MSIFSLKYMASFINRFGIEVKHCVEELLRLSEHRQGVLKELVTLAQSLPEYEILLSIPRIDETIATSIIG